jgi:hypothetical protein
MKNLILWAGADGMAVRQIQQAASRVRMAESKDLNVGAPSSRDLTASEISTPPCEL